MDILEENFPGALPAAHVQVHGHEMEGLKGLLLGLSDENRHLLDQGEPSCASHFAPSITNLCQRPQRQHRRTHSEISTSDPTGYEDDRALSILQL